ncbi:MAG: hypothetical protein LKI85_07365 [Enterobacter sp.]|jgi:hypothetical protein|nr:hypothetical protein [Enterobacter sp.]
MGGTIDISEVGMTVNMAGGGKIVIGDWGDNIAPKAEPLPPLTPEEELYGRDLCLLPVGWEDLSGDGHWQYHLSKSLRHLWPSFSREQKMAIAYSISELSDELTNIAYDGSW